MATFYILVAKGNKKPPSSATARAYILDEVTIAEAEMISSYKKQELNLQIRGHLGSPYFFFFVETVLLLCLFIYFFISLSLFCVLCPMLSILVCPFCYL